MSSNCRCSLRVASIDFALGAGSLYGPELIQPALEPMNVDDDPSILWAGIGCVRETQTLIYFDIVKMGRVSLFFVCFAVLAVSHVACINYFPDETFNEIMEHAQLLRESVILGEDTEALRDIQNRIYEGGDIEQRKYLMKEALKLYSIVTPLLKRQLMDAKQIQTRINELPYRASPVCPAHPSQPSP